MAGIIDRRAYGYRAKQNKRIHKYTAVTIDAADTAQNQEYCDIPGGANVAALGLTTEHFVEPNYFVPQGTDPTTVTGSTPPTYSLAGRPVSVCVAGRARAVAASAINEGDEVNVADSSGRVKTVSESAGTLVYVLGRAQTKASNANDIVIVEVAPYYKKT